MDRKKFIHLIAQSGVTVSVIGLGACQLSRKKDKQIEKDRLKFLKINPTSPFFKLSLSQWSLHRTLFKKEIDNLDFARKAKSYGVEGLEYVNIFFQDKARNIAYLNEMNKRAEDQDLKNLLLMIDNEGDLGILYTHKRKKNLEKHFKWIEAAKYLGCHSVRVNIFGEGTRKEQANAAIDSLSCLSVFAAQENINILVENDIGFSSDPQWLVEVIKEVDMSNCGLLPSFRNFYTSNKKEQYFQTCDNYKSIEFMMPFAKALSVKARTFNDNGYETKTDYLKLMQIIKSSGYQGYISICYEGNILNEDKGIKRTKALIEKVSCELI